MDYYLGVDGGGTKTEFVLCDENGNILNRIIKDGCNPNDKGVDGSFRVIKEGITECVKSRGIDEKEVTVYAGVSGALAGGNASALFEKLEPFYKCVQVQSDLSIGVETAIGDDDGILVICGTGISCALSYDNQFKIVGGYGYLFEEGGSGYCIGRDGVVAVLRAEDGYGEKTVLTDMIKNKTGSSVHGRLRYFLENGKSYISSFAPLVFDGYEQKDKVCERIIDENICSVCSLVNSAITLFPKQKCKIAFIGGITRLQVFREKIMQAFKSEDISFCEISPVFGAVKNAVKISGKSVDENFNRNYLRSYENA